MPGRAFIPGPLSQAQPRVYKALRGRQLRGLLAAGAGAAIGLLIFKARDVSGYAAAFLMAVPGFAYGYFQPEGKPVEYWLLVLLRFYFKPQRLSHGISGPWWRRWYLEGLQLIRALRRARQMRNHKGVRKRG